MSSAKPSVVSGSVLVASGAIGAGMFSLPVVSAGAWTLWSLLGLAVVYVASLIATLLLAKINLRFTPGASFDSVVGQTLGATWNRINNLTIWFLLAILLYAYFSASSSIVSHTLSSLGVEKQLPPSVTGLIFGAIVALVVWSGSQAVSKLCGLLVVVMAISFSVATGGLLVQIDTQLLLSTPANTAQYLWYPLPYFVTAFACAGLVPSLIKHYHGDAQAVNRSIILGSTITLLVYIVWLAANFGTLSRPDLSAVIQAGGNMGDLASALQQRIDAPRLPIILTIFSNLAITTSFLSIALGLFDYLADRFKFSSDSFGRAKTALLCFGPPAILSALFPKGFILAIGYAGLAVLFSFFFMPVLMAARQYLAPKSTLLGLLAFTVTVAICKLLTIFSLLPSYQ